ncbi:MAG: hypothetical protein A2X35_04600 [Elusimicrobia bacterium GWA2_61_42]|nr:MAG: hypothetical protein A2X35_04600 [Elusimicrobia bacterium GWA2_61_42]OGR76621.1 MAG: hypothetical protein A2X38_03515 [Elusimicrobia bacterium GWC2_61_25]
MEKLSALLLGADARAALRGLGKLGCLQLAPAEAAPGCTSSEPRDKGAALARCRELAKKAEGLRRQLGGGRGAGFGAGRNTLNVEEAGRELAAIEAQALPLLERRRLAAEALAAAIAAKEKGAAYAAVPLPSDKLGDFRFLRCFTGSLPSENFRRLAAAPDEKWLLSALSERAGRTVVLGLADRDSAAGLEAALKNAGFSPEAPPGRPGLTLEAAAAYFTAEEKKCRLRAELAGSALEELADRSRGALAAAGGAAALEERLLEAEQSLPRTSAAALLSGWVPAPKAKEVRLELEAATAGRLVLKAAPAAGDVPVLLDPPPLFRPFAGVVRAYGLPGYGEADPTAPAAVIYVLMFGAMFGDAGHGAVVCAGGAWLALKGRGAARAAGRLAAYCGLSAAAFGLVYGSCFGLESLRKYALWRDPLEGDPFGLVLAALYAGAAVISLGAGLNILNRLAAGDRLGALLGRFGGAGLLFYWSAILTLSGGLAPRFGLPLLGAALVCWALEKPLECLAERRRGNKTEGWLEISAEALVGTFEGALLYLANTVSFARLAAYAMSHAALLAAAWSLRDAADQVWGHNSAAGLLAVLAGNAAAIGLEGLVAAVQALRLEYYEFFGKFFEGGGRPFKPFVLEPGGMK